MDQKSDMLVALASDLSAGSVRMSFKISPEIGSMLEALGGGQRTIKDVLKLAVLGFATCVHDEKVLPLENFVDREDSPKNFQELKNFLKENSSSSEFYEKLCFYFEQSYGNFENFIFHFKKSLGEKEKKISKTFVVSNGIKNFINRMSSSMKLSKSSLFEMIIRSEYSKNIYIKTERAKKYYSIFSEIYNEIENIAESIDSVRNKAYDLLKEHHLDRENEIFYPELIISSNYRRKGFEAIQVSMGNFEAVRGIIWSDVVGPLGDAIEEEKEILTNNNFDPEDYIVKGGEK